MRKILFEWGFLAIAALIMALVDDFIKTGKNFSFWSAFLEDFVTQLIIYLLIRGCFFLMDGGSKSFFSGSVLAILIILDLCFLISYPIGVIEEEKKERKLAYISSIKNSSVAIDVMKLFSLQECDELNSAGVYILTNNLNGRNYVGQSIHVLNRVKNHFSGKGNPDVYKDYCDGVMFSCKFIFINNTECKTLNELERIMIEEYAGFTNGYNKTRGNKG